MARHFARLSLLVLLLPGCLWSLEGPSGEASVEAEARQEELDWTLIRQEYPVQKVISGDTLEVEYPILGSWETVTVKLLGVDAPDRLQKVMTEYQGLAAFAMVLVALDRSNRNPEMLSLTDRDMLQERVNRIIEEKEFPPLRGVRLLDDEWEVRTQMWPFIPLRARVVIDPKTRSKEIRAVYAYVYVGNLLLNRFLIEEGFAKVHKDHIFDLRPTFEEAEKRAKARGIGIWGVD